MKLLPTVVSTKDVKSYGRCNKIARLMSVGDLTLFPQEALAAASPHTVVRSAVDVPNHRSQNFQAQLRSQGGRNFAAVATNHQLTVA